MRFPMDLVDWDIIVGHLNGILEGGARMVTGVWGKALYIDGQPGSRVDYGVHTDGCFFDPDQCDEGITISMWLRVPEIYSGFGLIFDNGGCTPDAVGYCLQLIDDELSFTINQRLQRYAFGIKGYTPNQWFLMTITYFDNNGSIYVNGCKMALYWFDMIKPRPDPHSMDSVFYIGDWAAIGFTPHVTIDDLLVWYTALSAEEMWNLYVQGGRPS